MGHGERLVCVRVALSNNDTPLPATIYEKGRKPVLQYLNAHQKAQIGNDLVAYFHAEKIGPLYYLGERQRGGWKW